MKGDDIGDRFKDYERCYDFTLPRRLPLVIRVDGRAFHSLKLTKPFDSSFWAAMMCTAMELCREIQGARLAFFQSDEITVIARDDMSIQTQPWVGKRLSKILSLSAAIATSAFNRASDYGPCQFDARAFVVPSMDEAINCLIWRQQDATRNSVQMLARSVFSHKECDRKNTAALLEMLRARAIEWDSLATVYKRGAVVKPVVTMKPVPQTGQTVPRRGWVVDPETPIFTQDRVYLERLYVTDDWPTEATA